MLVGCKKGKCCQHSIKSGCKPPINMDCSNTFFERSFLYAAPHEWNSLERGVRVCEFNASKKAMKSILFIQCYHGLNKINDAFDAYVLMTV